MKATKRHSLGMGVLIALFTLSLFGLNGAAAAGKVYRLKIQSAWPHGDISMGLLKEFASAVEKKSNGRVKIKVFAAPDIVPTENLFNACKRGTVDMMQGGGVVWGNIIPVANVEFGLPGTFMVPEEKTFEGKAEAIRKFFFKSGLVDILREEYAKQGLYFLDIHVYGPVPITLSTKEIKKCSDLKGMIVRADGLDMIYQAAVGMKPVSVPGEEAYVALKTGVVDAAEWDISCITGLKWYEVAPYWLRGMENDDDLGSIEVNMKKWNSLPDDIKAIIADAAKDYFYATVRGYKEAMDEANQLVKEGKLFSIELDQECRDKYAARAKKIMDEEAVKDPATAKAIKLVKKWRGIQ
ncbi:MAG: TRAP transporter substrate-binding protein DctP [Desulfatiglandaceae bacterium]